MDRRGGARTAYIENASPFRATGLALIPAGLDRRLCRRWENGYVESFNVRPGDELLVGAILYNLRKATVVIESWTRHYNQVRPHTSVGYRAPAPEVTVPAFAAST